MVDPIEHLARAAGIPAHMLRGELRGGNERDVRKYITATNATYKGLKRKMRRLKAYLGKMERKGKP